MTGFGGHGGHRCDEWCVCPIHRTPLIYWPAGDDHACQDVNCQYGHGGVPGPLDVVIAEYYGAAAPAGHGSEEERGDG